MDEAETQARQHVHALHHQILHDNHRIIAQDIRHKQTQTLHRLTQYLDAAMGRVKAWDTLQKELLATATLKIHIEQAHQSIRNAVTIIDSLEKEYIRLKEFRNKQVLKTNAEELNKIYQAQRKQYADASIKPPVDPEAFLDDLFEKDIQVYKERTAAAQSTSAKPKEKLENVQIEFKMNDLDSFFDDDPVPNSSHAQESKSQSPLEDDDDWD
jgi:hypothetical protein